MFDLAGDVGAAADARDVFADDDVEPAAGALGLGEQVGEAAVTRYGNVELFVGMPATALVEVHAPGLDIVEVHDDRGGLGQCVVTGPNLQRQRQGRVLLVVGGGATGERHPGEVRLSGRGWGPASE